MSSEVTIGLQLDVSAVVVSVTMAMLANRFDSMEIAGFATFIKYSS
jgi:hypothetical protein